MGVLFEKVSDRVFEILKGFKQKLTLYDSQGSEVDDPKNTRYMFSTTSGMMVNIVENGSNSKLSVHVSKDVNVIDIFEMLDQLKKTATHFNLEYELKTYASKITPKDFSSEAIGNIGEKNMSKTNIKEFKDYERWLAAYDVDALLEHARIKSEMSAIKHEYKDLINEYNSLIRFEKKKILERNKALKIADYLVENINSKKAYMKVVDENTALDIHSAINIINKTWKSDTALKIQERLERILLGK